MRSGEAVAVLGTAFQIGRSALAAYQSAITVTGQNIANVGNADYTRQSARLAALAGGTVAAGPTPGAGVDIAGLERHIDEALEGRLRLALGARSGAETSYQALSRVETLYNELTDYDVSSLLGQFFNSFSNLQTDPTDTTARGLVLSNAEALIQSLQRQRSGLLDQLTDLNASAEELTRVANGLTEEIAKLNELVVATEARTPGGAGALRDRRDGLLRQLGELIDIQTRDQGNGIVNVYVGSEPLVDYARSRGLKIEVTRENGLDRATVRFADNNGTVVLRSGKLAATVQARDEALIGQLTQLDQFAGALIYEVNRVHSVGRGLIGYTQATGTYAAADANAALNSAPAGLPFPVQNGTFLVQVRDKASGRTLTRQIEVDLDGLGDSDTTLTSLATALSTVPGLSATVTADNRLAIRTTDAAEFSFAEDSSGVLAALGIGTLFDGTNATTMALNSSVRADPRLLAASLDGSVADGSNAGRLAAAGDAASALLNNVSVRDFQQRIVHDLAVAVAAADTDRAAADAVYSNLLAQREATSGVNLDEEAINLTKFERSFQGASRFISVLDQLADEIIGLVG